MQGRVFPNSFSISISKQRSLLLLSLASLYSPVLFLPATLLVPPFTFSFSFFAILFPSFEAFRDRAPNLLSVKESPAWSAKLDFSSWPRIEKSYRHIFHSLLARPNHTPPTISRLTLSTKHQLLATITNKPSPTTTASYYQPALPTHQQTTTAIPDSASPEGTSFLFARN